MRRGVAAFALVAAALAASAAPGTAGERKSPPRLTLVATSPLTVAGSRFRAGEGVRLVAAVGEVRQLRRARAGATGAFRVSFAGVTRADRCLGGFVTATGSRGSRASLKLPQPACPPPLYGVR